MSRTSRDPLVCFGVLADVQYADCENRPAIEVTTTHHRYYRQSRQQIEAAFKTWKESPNKIRFALQLGDVIDGRNQKVGQSHAALRTILNHFEAHPLIPTFHTVGNHELINFNKSELISLLYESSVKMNIDSGIFPIDNSNEGFRKFSFYYEFSPVPSLRIICLDCYDISILGYDTKHAKYQEAINILSSWCGLDSIDSFSLENRFRTQNGAIGKEQLEWLNAILKQSDAMGQKVIIFGHVSLNPDSSVTECLLWNYDEVVEVFHRHKCVTAYFCGHTHESNCATDSQGIHYVTFKGIIETPPDTTAFATVAVYDDAVEITGHGIEKSYHFQLLEK